MSFASWRKCDFQVHTPRDANWQGARTVGLGEDCEGKTATAGDVDADRARWADFFVEKCAQKGLEAVALTDHHEMVMVPYVQEAIARRKKVDGSFDLWLFPGMELTCHGGVQALILFDADLSESWRNQVQQRLGIVTANLEEKAARSPARVEQLHFNYADLAGAIDSIHDDIKGRYIILPNVSQGNSHTVLRDGHHLDFKRMPYVGGYVDNGQNITTLGSKNLKRLSGTNAKWGDRYIYPLPTSDCRNVTYSDLGANSCWIKLATPTAEAIRQAFLGFRSRIAIEQPSTASLAVARIALRGTTILSDLSLDMSPELNSLIGGRGSGKSSLLEYIAFGLGRSCYDMDKQDYSGGDRMGSLVKETLISAGGSVELTLRQDRATFVITRSSASGYQPSVRYPDGSVQPLSARELRTLFPAVVYSQGELSELGKQAGKKSQLSDLLQFVSQDYKKEDDQLANAIALAREAVRSAAQQLASAWRAQSQLHKLETGKQALEQRIIALNKTLPTLSPEDQQVVDRFERLNAFEGARAQASSRAEVIVKQLSDLWVSSKMAVDVRADLPEAVPFVAAFEAFDKAFWEGLTDFGRTLAEKRNALEAAASEWASLLAGVRKARDSVMAKLSEHKTVTTQVEGLLSELNAATLQIAELKSNMRSADDAATAMTAAGVQLREAVRARGERTEAWAQEIETLSNGRIRATVNVEGDISEIREAIDIVAAKTNSQEAPRQRQVEDAIAETSAWAFINGIRAECQALLFHKLVGASQNGEPPQCALLYATLGGSERTRAACFDLIDTTRLEAVATAAPRPDITLTYCDHERTISFDKASEGQRAAALLFMLLQQPGGPLIIDQPENDLDNSVISDLMDVLHDAKQRRQIIFASHNANVVVNGSSELVAHLEVGPDGMRAPDNMGAIDLPDVCRTITATMEGGEKAFRDRKVKYGY